MLATSNPTNGSQAAEAHMSDSTATNSQASSNITEPSVRDKHLRKWVISCAWLTEFINTKCYCKDKLAWLKTWRMRNPTVKSLYDIECEIRWLLCYCATSTSIKAPFGQLNGRIGCEVKKKQFSSLFSATIVFHLINGKYCGESGPLNGPLWLNSVSDIFVLQVHNVWVKYYADCPLEGAVLLTLAFSSSGQEKFSFSIFQRFVPTGVGETTLNEAVKQQSCYTISY